MQSNIRNKDTSLTVPHGQRRPQKQGTLKLTGLSLNTCANTEKLFGIALNFSIHHYS